MSEVIQMYIYKTIIAFISIKAILIMFKDNWKQLNPKHNGFIKRNFNTLIPCLIPIFRWLWLIIIIICSFSLLSPKVVERCKEKNNIEE